MTWKAIHFGFWMEMTVQITKMNAPNSFTDEMVSGPFKYMRHCHLFHAAAGGTQMIDEFDFQSPLGIAGRAADALVLKNYMRNLLARRNKWIKQHAETMTAY